jgi:hypothetical protein
VSDFVLHAAKQNGYAILKWDHPVLAFSGFSFCRGSNLSFLWIERCFCPPPPLPWADSNLFVRRFEVMEAFEVVGEMVSRHPVAQIRREQ